MNSAFGSFVESARAGALRLQMDPEGFAELDKACNTFKAEIQALQRIADNIGNQQVWGFGESVPALTSAVALARKFREKGRGGENNLYDTLQQHYDLVTQIQTMFREICKNTLTVDEMNAAGLQAIASEVTGE